MRSWLVAIVAVLMMAISAPLATANEDLVVQANYDLFHDIDLETMDENTACDGNAEANAEPSSLVVAPDGKSFTFEEDVDPIVGAEPPEARTGCAMARFHFAVPAGSDHMHIRFDADRRIDQAATLQNNIIQRVLILDGDGALIESRDYFAREDGSRDPTRLFTVGNDRFDLPEGLQKITVVWHFQDAGQQVQSTSTLGSGQAFSATVWDPWVEFSGQVVDMGQITHGQIRSGDKLQATHEIPLTVPAELLEDYEPNIRVLINKGIELKHIVTPSGTILDDVGTTIAGDEYSSRLDRILFETFSDLDRFTLAGKDVARNGAGEYTFVFVETTVLEPSFALYALNWVLIATPLGLAAFAYRGAYIFRREAFGQYEKTARHLIFGLLFTSAYYLSVIVTAIVAGWFGLMATLPLGWEAVLLYLQVIIALAAFIQLYRTGKAMLLIVQPEPLK